MSDQLDRLAWLIDALLVRSGLRVKDCLCAEGCRDCDGMGWHLEESSPERCRSCYGSGENRYRDDCEECDGKGTTPDWRRIDS